MAKKSVDKTVKQEKQEPTAAEPPATEPPAPRSGPTRSEAGLGTKPTAEDLAYVLFLLANLSLTSHALQTNLKPLFGKTYGTLSFQFGALVSFVVFTYLLPNSVATHRRALEIASVLQVAASVGARSLGAFTLPYFDQDPTTAAWIVHSVSSFPALGLGGAVWLHWAAKFMDEEPTRGGRLIIKVFSCIALISVIKYLEPLVGNAALRYGDIPPKAILVVLGMTMFTLSVIFRPPGNTSAARRSSDSGVYSLSKSISMLSIFMAMLVVVVPPRTPSNLSVQYQRFTPYGFIQVVDNNATTPVTRYVRLDSSILGEVELKGDASVGDAKGVSAALLEGTRLVKGSKGKRALVIGIQSGAAAKSLLSSSYNTTIVDINAPLIEAIQTYFDLPTPNTVIERDPVIWAMKYAKPQSRVGSEEKMDIVIHDVFDGGELPARDYTMEFWAAIRNVIDENGVLAVRYVGKPTAVTFKSTLNMLRKNYRTCRAFHSNPVDQPLSSAPNVVSEVVIYCTLANTLLFTPPSASSQLSASASTILSTLEKREVDINEVLTGVSPDRYLLKEEDPAVRRIWGTDGITEYWKLMRQRYPESVWYSY